MLQDQRGFTLLEALVVIAMVGMVTAIAAPGWFGFLEKNRLTVASDKLYLVIREAQLEAQSKRTVWQFSLRERDDSIEWAVHPSAMPSSTVQWQTLESQSIRIDGETTFVSTSGTYYVRFDERGNPHRLGRVTLSGKRFPSNKRCVIISTVIGATRKAKEKPAPDPTYRTRDRFCY